MRTKTELTLEQTQQGVSDKVLAETESIHMLSETPKLLSGIEDSHHGPIDVMHNPSHPLKVSQKTLVSFLIEITRISIDFLTPKHQSDTKVFTMTMEILPDPTSNKLCGSFEMLCEEVLKLKNFKKDGYTSFQNQEKYEHVGLKVTSTQDGKRSQDDDKRLCLVDDLKEVQVHIQVKLKGTSSSLKSKDRYTYHKLKDKDSRPRAKTEDIRRM
ncbi:hypothetical protein Tco_0320815 [Tanacetum coccineum]